MAFLRNIATVGSCTLISRVLGFLRDILIAAVLGAGPVADAFFVAFKLPNFFRRLFAEGAFSAAFVPVFSGRVGLEGKDKAMVFASQAASMLMWSVLALVLLFEIAMPWFMHVLAPGFVGEPEKFALAVEFSRITFPYILFISLVSLQGGILNTLDRFAAMAATPILLNLCMITALIGFCATPQTPGQTPGHILSWSVALAGVVQFVWLWAALKREGVSLRFGRPVLSPEIKRLLKLFLPVALGAGVYQVNLIIDLIIASLLPTGAISYLYFADRVNQLPLGVVGIAVGTALLPLLARQVKGGEIEAAKDSQNRAIGYSMLLTLPACSALLVLAVPITVVLFERGAFTGADASATGHALAAFACGLPAYVLIKVLAPGYFAREDTATPIKIGIFAMVVNVALNLLLIGPLAHVGIALATAIAAWINAALLGVGLWRRGHFTPDRHLTLKLIKMAAAALVMAAALNAAAGYFAGPLSGLQVERFAALGGLVLGGVIVYFALAHIFGAAKIDLLWHSRGREME